VPRIVGILSGAGDATDACFLLFARVYE